MSGDLSIELRSPRPRYRSGEPITLEGTYVNRGSEPLVLTFWWNRTARVVDEKGQVVNPGPGPVLPCGVKEEGTLLGPGERLARDEPLGCTQPAGQQRRIGWSYDLAPGSYKVSLVFEHPPAHGFTQSSPDARSFRGRVTSNEVSVLVDPPPAKAPGLLARLLGG